MIAFDTNVLIYCCDDGDARRKAIALDLVANAEDGVLIEGDVEPDLRSQALREAVSRVEWNGRRCRIVLDDAGVLGHYASLWEEAG